MLEAEIPTAVGSPFFLNSFFLKIKFISLPYKHSHIMIEQDVYAGCWYCDNIVAHPGWVGLLHMGFPRCFILIPDQGAFIYSTYEEFVNTARITWLEPMERYTVRDMEMVIAKLWNFAIEQEDMEDEMYESNLSDNF